MAATPRIEASEEGEALSTEELERLYAGLQALLGMEESEVAAYVTRGDRPEGALPRT